jgi:hypothetical protein
MSENKKRFDKEGNKMKPEKLTKKIGISLAVISAIGALSTEGPKNKSFADTNTNLNTISEIQQANEGLVQSPFLDITDQEKEELDKIIKIKRKNLTALDEKETFIDGFNFNNNEIKRLVGENKEKERVKLINDIFKGVGSISVIALALGKISDLTKKSK